MDISFGKPYSKWIQQQIQSPKNTKFYGVCPRGVMVKAMDCRIIVSEFVLQSRYYVHFRANILGGSMNPLILPAIRVPLMFF